LKFAITDIETTGSYASGNSITEIGICLHDGEKVIREFQTLLNPGVYVPPYITSLTGISNEMLEDAPTFADVADELLELFEDAVFVAHNVSFDYSFIKAEFEALGIKWQSRRMCTVKLTRKAFPGLPSYSLGNACQWLGITNEQAHRALSDARAATQLFDKARQIMDPADIQKMITRGAPDIFLPLNLDRAEYDALPEKAGVYYLLNEKGKPIYIGKAKNLKKRVQQHFTTNPGSKKLQDFMKEIHHVSFELTGTELVALLLEDYEIRQHWPKHNAAQKNRVNKQTIIRYTDQKGYERLAMNKGNNTVAGIKTFSTAYRAKEWLMKMANEFDLDMRLLGLDMFDTTRTWHEPDQHNNALDDALRQLQKREPSFVMRGTGRHEDEYTCVLVRQGVLRGYGFVPATENTLEAIEACIKLLPPTETNAAIMRHYIENPESYNLIMLEQEAL
jgi:DNA polymerase-3 subunit epsilon